MQGDILAQGVELMIYGMGTVVVFLSLLIVITTLMSKVVTRYFPETILPTQVRTPDINSTAPKSAVPEGELVAAVTAAIHLHRSKK